MRLLALRAETMQGVRRLKLPCDDITPIGLWGSDMFLIGVNNEQFEVLRMWNVQTEDVTPASLREVHTDSPAIPTSPSAGNAASGARSSATGATAPSLTTSSFPPSAPMTFSSPTPVSVPAMERSSAASSSTPSPSVASVSIAEPESASVAPESVAPDWQVGNTIDLESPVDAVTRGGSSTETRGGSAKQAKEPEPKPSGDGKDANAGKLRMTIDGEHLYAEIKSGKIVLKDRTYDSLAHARDSIRRERNKVAVWEYFDEGVKAWRVLNRD